MRAYLKILALFSVILISNPFHASDALAAQARKTNTSKQVTKKKRTRGKTMQEKIEEERRAMEAEAQERLRQVQEEWEEREKKRREQAEKSSNDRPYHDNAYVPVSSPTPEPTPAPTQNTQTQPQQSPAAQSPSATQPRTAYSDNDFNDDDYDSYSIRGRSSHPGSQSYYGKNCKVPNLDYSKFNKDWGKALLDRMSGAAPVVTENGTVLNGPMDFMRTAQALARDIGCPSIDPNDHDQANYLVAAVVIAIACPESGWNPKAIYDERLSGGVAGKDWSREANESRGLLQMTKKSDHDPKNGCVLRSQADLDGPITNLMCGLAKIKKRGYTTLISFSEYWSVARKMNTSIKAAVRRECRAGYPNIKAYVGEGGSARAAASTHDSNGSAQ